MLFNLVQLTSIAHLHRPLHTYLISFPQFFKIIFYGFFFSQR